MFYPMPGRAGQGWVKVEIVCGWGGVAWRGVGFGRVGKGRVGLGLGVGEGVYMGLGKVGSVGMLVLVGGEGVTSTTKPQFYHTLLNPISTPTPPHPYPFQFYITLSY